MVDKGIQKEEAIRRLKMLCVHPNVIREFRRKTPLLNYSDRGILYWIENDEWKKIISEFEEKYGAMVYHAIFSRTEFGDLLSLLYVSENEEEWHMDRDDMNEGIAYAYVANLDDPFCSEIGGIGIRPFFGGVLRTA